MCKDIGSEENILESPIEVRWLAKPIRFFNIDGIGYEYALGNSGGVLRKMDTHAIYTKELSKIYFETLAIEPKVTLLEGYLIDMYGTDDVDGMIQEVKSMLDKKPYIAARIKDWLKCDNSLAEQPAIFLIYLAIYKNVREAKDKWQLVLDDLEPFLNDLGHSAYT